MNSWEVTPDKRAYRTIEAILAIPDIGQTSSQADAAVWYNDADADAYADAQSALAENGTRSNNQYMMLPIVEVHARAKEMIQCIKVDPEPRTLYRIVRDFYMEVVSDRDFRFLQRHRLIQQEREEDAKGLR